MVQLARLVETSNAVRSTRSRAKKVASLAELIRGLAPDEIEAAVSFLCGRLPQGKIGLGWRVVSEARSEAGVALQSNLSVKDVNQAFDDLAQISGSGSKAHRLERVGGLLSRATADEAKFIGDLMLSVLRQGALEGLMVDAVAKASEVTLQEVRRAQMVAGDLPKIAVAAMTGGSEALARFGIEMFRPLLPMLAQPADAMEDVIGRLGEAAFEHKIDGARIQVHKDQDEVRVFSRRLNEVTAALPEVVEVARTLPYGRLILDGETIALRPNGRPHPFQITMRRFGRRLDVAAMRAELPLSAMFFDVIHVDGQDLLTEPSAARQVILADALPPALRVPRIVTADPDEAEVFFDAAVAAGHEGVMAKALDASYEAGGRGKSWLKLKPAHTLDLVVLAVEQGSGRRQGWLSNLHLGARDPSDGSFVMLGKTFKGMTDEMLRWQTQHLGSLEIGREGHVVHVRPELVVEIAFNDLQTSPRYSGGLALRFARVKRYRTDKTAAEADTIETVRALHRAQTA